MDSSAASRLQVLLGNSLLQVLGVEGAFLGLDHVLNVLLLVQETSLLPSREGGRGAGCPAGERQEDKDQQEQNDRKIISYDYRETFRYVCKPNIVLRILYRNFRMDFIRLFKMIFIK